MHVGMTKKDSETKICVIADVPTQVPGFSVWH